MHAVVLMLLFVMLSSSLLLCCLQSRGVSIEIITGEHCSFHTSALSLPLTDVRVVCVVCVVGGRSDTPYMRWAATHIYHKFLRYENIRIWEYEPRSALCCAVLCCAVLCCAV